MHACLTVATIQLHSIYIFFVISVPFLLFADLVMSLLSTKVMLGVPRTYGGLCYSDVISVHVNLIDFIIRSLIIQVWLVFLLLLRITFTYIYSHLKLHAHEQHSALATISNSETSFVCISDKWENLSRIEPLYTTQR